MSSSLVVSLINTVQRSVLCCALRTLWGVPSLTDCRAGWSRVWGIDSCRCWNRSHLRLICHRYLWNCSNYIGWIATGGWLTTSAPLTSTLSGATPRTSLGSTAVGLSWSICRRHIFPGATWTSYISGPVFLTISPERHFRYCVTNL